MVIRVSPLYGGYTHNSVFHRIFSLDVHHMSAIIAENESPGSPGRHSRTMPLRRSWLMVLLALLMGTFAFVYCGRVRRALSWLVVWWCVVAPLCGSIMLYLPNGKVAFYGALLVFLLAMITFVFDALRVSKQQHGQPWKAYQKWWAYLIVLVVIAGFTELGLQTIRYYWTESFVVSANSMKETLVSGDRFMVEKLFFDFKNVDRGDVVVFHAPTEPSVVYVKRVIARGGETIVIKDDQVSVNGELLVEPYVNFQGNHQPPAMEKLRNFPATVVPVGHVFVMGDNRWASYDSRFWGMVPIQNLLGEARLLFWSREHVRTPPTRENPREEESWGKLRWDRIGRLVK